jgi:hypothetical protein
VLHEELQTKEFIMTIRATKDKGIQVRKSWTEQFMDWYPRYSKLYRRRSNKEAQDFSSLSKIQFEELLPFFQMMEKSIRNQLVNQIVDKINDTYFDEGSEFDQERAIRIIKDENEH